MHVLVFIDLGVGVFWEENGGEARYSLEGVDSGCGGVRVRGLKLGLGGGVRTWRAGASASSAPFTVRPNTVAATGKGHLRDIHISVYPTRLMILSAAK